VKLNKDPNVITEIRKKISIELDDPKSKINKNGNSVRDNGRKLIFYHLGLSLLLSLIEVDQRKRISAAQALKHPYFEATDKRMIRFGSSKDMIYDTLRSSWYSTLYLLRY